MSVSKRDAVKALWRRGILDYKLYDNQKVLKEYIDNVEDRIKVVVCARRFGKSFLMALRAVETCLKKNNAIVKYICPKQKMVKTIIKPNMREILKDCPPDMVPEWKENDKVYIFPNGSEIQLAGTDNGNHENLRGGSADLCIVDEAGFCDELEYVIYSVLYPTITTTKGQVILTSTPSKDPNHDFITLFVNPLEAEGKLKKFTVYDNVMIDEEELHHIMKNYGGETNREFRREFLCEVQGDLDQMVVPEFTHEIEKQLVAEWPRPVYYDAYVSADIGFRDLTVVLFGYYDFLKAKLIVEDELVFSGGSMNTENFAAQVMAKERELFYDSQSKEPITPYMRVMDNNLILINDLHQIHKLSFIPTRKDDKETAINQMRLMVAAGEIIINPKCKTLIYHLKSAQWDNKRKQFKRMPATLNSEVQGGHADAVDALVYMVRNLVRSHNPYPAGWGGITGDLAFESRMTKENPLAKTVKKILNLK